MTSARGALLVTCLLVGAFPRNAHADELKACNDALVAGQELTKGERLLDARAQYPICLRSDCDPAIRAVCANFLTRLSADIPSVRFEARSSSGAPVRATFFVDDVLVADSSRPTELDPGRHRIRAEADGYERSEHEYVIVAGEHERRVLVDLFAVETATAKRPSVRPLTAGTIVLGSLALVAGASFAYFGLKGRSTEASLRASCPNGPCDSSPMRAQYLVADVSALVALVSAGSALWLALRHGERR